MFLRKFVSLSLFSLVILAAVGAFSAFSAANTIPPTRLTNQNFPILLRELTPPECLGLGLTQLVVLANGDTTSNQRELVLGTPNNDNIDSNGGEDCILGGGGDDIILGGSGKDILFGGPGIDSLDGGGGKGDICYGGGQTGQDTFARCETRYP